MYFSIISVIFYSLFLDSVSLTLTKIEGSNNYIWHMHGISEEFHEDPGSFTKIGSNYYYIEKQDYVNWFEAAMRCRQMGGNLANIQSESEVNDLTSALDASHRYWIDLTDLAKNGNFRSLTTGLRKGSYPLWAPGEPNNLYGGERCVHMFKHFNQKWVINDQPCLQTYLFVCESSVPSTITIVNW